MFAESARQATFEAAVDEANENIKKERKKLKGINKKTQSGKLRVAETTRKIKELEIIRDNNQSKVKTWGAKAEILQNIQKDLPKPQQKGLMGPKPQQEEII